MKSNFHIFFLLVCLWTLTASSQTTFSEYAFCDSQIIVSIPSSWKFRDQSKHFAVNEWESQTELADKKFDSYISIAKYRPQYGPKAPITDSIVKVRMESMRSDPVRNYTFEASGITLISGIKTGFIKYTSASGNSTGRTYAIDLFFCNKDAVYFHITISGTRASVSSFRPVAERIFESVRFNFR